MPISRALQLSRQKTVHWFIETFPLQCMRSSRIYVHKISLVLSLSLRWTSGSPRMLLVLVREFESRRGEILNLFAKIKKKDQLLRAPSVGKRNSTRVDERRKSWNLLAIKCKGRTSWVGSEKSLLCDPGSELRLGGKGENRRAKILKWKKCGVYDTRT